MEANDHLLTDPISTHAPLRGATGRAEALAGQHTFLLTRLCEARLPRPRGLRQDDAHFYSRASARRDRSTSSPTRPRPHFYSRASARRDQADRQQPDRRPDFYSRASARRDIQPGRGRPALPDFYSRASARRDTVAMTADAMPTISTHAPLRGATRTSVPATIATSISTHAPLRGATAG